MDDLLNEYDSYTVKENDGTVIAYTIDPADCLKQTIKSYKINSELDRIKQKLIKTKNKYDKPYEAHGKKFIFITKQFELSSMFKHEISQKFNTPNVTNAWLKAYEIFSQYELFPKTADMFVYFDNAAFPGSFILAAHHYVKTQCDIKNFKWYGSSLLDSAYLEDTYGLFSNYPESWLMNEKNNGDVTSVENQVMFNQTLGCTVDLYTSDLGFDCSSDYNNQETLHAKANLGQILTGLNVLKNGGVLITKQYTYFEPFTVSLIGCLTFVFRELKIIKPMFSKPANSEIYILGLGYRRDPRVIDILTKGLATFDDNPMHPLLTQSCLGNAFTTSIRNSLHIYLTQCNTITRIITEFDRFKGKKYTAEYIKNNNFFTRLQNYYLHQWKNIHKIKPLSNHMQLNVKNMFRKKRN